MVVSVLYFLCTGEKPFHCDECEYATADHNSLRRHKMRHSGDKPYKCPHCSYACIQSSTYKAHLNTKHPGEWVLLFIYTISMSILSQSFQNFASYTHQTKNSFTTPKLLKKYFTVVVVVVVIIIIIIIILSSFRPVETCYICFKTESFHHFRDVPKLLFPLVDSFFFGILLEPDWKSSKISTFNAEKELGPKKSDKWYIG